MNTWISATEQARRIRKDVKAAQKTGNLDPQLKITVRSDSFAKGASVTIAVRNLADADVLHVDQDTAVAEHGTPYLPTARALAAALYEIADRHRVESRARYLDVTLAGLSMPREETPAPAAAPKPERHLSLVSPVDDAPAPAPVVEPVDDFQRDLFGNAIVPVTAPIKTKARRQQVEQPTLFNLAQVPTFATLA